jgi:hypothetical protein
MLEAFEGVRTRVGFATSLAITEAKFVAALAAAGGDIKAQWQANKDAFVDLYNTLVRTGMVAAIDVLVAQSGLTAATWATGSAGSAAAEVYLAGFVGVGAAAALVTAAPLVVATATLLGAAYAYDTYLADTVKSGAGAIFDLGSPPSVPVNIELHSSHSEYIITTSNGSLYAQDTVGGRDGTQTLSGVREINFTDGTGIFDPTGTAENVARLYQATLGRAPDVSGLEYWTAQVDEASVPLSAVASSFTTSAEFSQNYGSLSDSSFVSQLYQNGLGRTADAGGAQYWERVLALGASRGAVVLNFAESQESKANTLSTAGDVDSAEAYRLYQAALNRVPDLVGLSYWSSALTGGATPSQVAQNFINSPEYQKDYGALSASDFVATLYQNALHRAGDPDGQQFWTSKLQQGSSEAGVLIGFSDSLENRVQTASATHANWVFVPS